MGIARKFNGINNDLCFGYENGYRRLWTPKYPLHPVMSINKLRRHGVGKSITEIGDDKENFCCCSSFSGDFKRSKVFLPASLSAGCASSYFKVFAAVYALQIPARYLPPTSGAFFASIFSREMCVGRRSREKSKAYKITLNMNW